MSAMMTPLRTEPTTAAGMALPIVGEAGIEQAIQAERERLMAEAGLTVRPIAHFRRPEEKPFTKAERDHVTVLFGGLTLRHEQLILAAMEGLGYQTALVPTPRKADFQAGKEYGNNGQCNPTYFTVGALVNYLRDLRDRKGLTKDQILRDYVFITAGACGPCRFGMYESEYRLALRNAGFEGFRVLLFQQGGGLNQSEVEAGLEFNLNFFLSLLNGILMGDLLNEVAYHIRPYETEPGRTNEVFAECMRICEQRLRSKNYDELHGGALAKVLSRLTPVNGPDEAEKFLDQLRGEYYVSAFRECARLIDERIEVDYTRPRPTVKITGEFWAQTTEGDGNFNMFPFLEREGAEVLVEPIGTWIAYLINQARTKTKDETGLKKGVEKAASLAERIRLQVASRKKVFTFNVAEKILFREYDRLRHALGGTAHELANQLELQRLGHPYYNSRSGGGEGHLEVAKAIYYCNRDLAHMVLSLKPFGCMPSTQSDGAQAAVVAHFPDLIYLPIETSGEGDINAHSRVQMALGEAKAKCKAEFKRAVESTGYTIEQIREYVAAHRELRRPLQHVPHHQGTIGRAANFVLHVAERMKADGVARTESAAELVTA
jgi:predicted nucleotide-binding protein (sugar kinase/HSP70/actin superfamily)